MVSHADGGAHTAQVAMGAQVAALDHVLRLTLGPCTSRVSACRGKHALQTHGVRMGTRSMSCASTGDVSPSAWKLIFGIPPGTRKGKHRFMIS